MDAFLMIGQSNMAGRGELTDVAPIENPLCHMLRMGRWIGMAEPINPDRDVFSSKFRSGISLAASFADSYANAYRRNVGLIPCAYGGTRISEWMPGEVLFDHAVMQAKLAMRSSQLKGILWHQGESDCTNPADFENYEQMLVTMFAELRKELGMPEVPIVMGEISELTGEQWHMEGRNLEFNRRLRVTAEAIPGCAVALAKGLTLKDDGLHFNAVSCRKFGLRYFEAYQSLMTCMR